MTETRTYLAFIGDTLAARGGPSDIEAAVAKAEASGQAILVFDAVDARAVWFDRGGALRPQDRADAEEPRGRGRPKLGVVGREVTLLPRHWDWLGARPGGASVALRKLVEAAMRESAGADRVRFAREAAYRFLTALGGDKPGYEAALRALFAGDRSGYEAALAEWPIDVRAEAARFAESAFD